MPGKLPCPFLAACFVVKVQLLGMFRVVDIMTDASSVFCWGGGHNWKSLQASCRCYRQWQGNRRLLPLPTAPCWFQQLEMVVSLITEMRWLLRGAFSMGLELSATLRLFGKKVSDVRWFLWPLDIEVSIYYIILYNTIISIYSPLAWEKMALEKGNKKTSSGNW